MSPPEGLQVAMKVGLCPSELRMQGLGLGMSPGTGVWDCLPI